MSPRPALTETDPPEPEDPEPPNNPNSPPILPLPAEIDNNPPTSFKESPLLIATVAPAVPEEPEDNVISPADPEALSPELICSDPDIEEDRPVFIVTAPVEKRLSMVATVMLLPLRKRPLLSPLEIRTLPPCPSVLEPAMNAASPPEEPPWPAVIDISPPIERSELPTESTIEPVGA